MSEQIDPIDRYKLINDLTDSKNDNWHTNVPNWRTHELEHLHTINVVREQPSIQSIVYCKDCKRRGVRLSCPMMVEPDDYYFGQATDETEDDDFSSRGEMKENMEAKHEN